eukprot:TRINITY_DN2347_c0_g1_i5.p1 TRINITY_DN2347_c0_g1~~TRINITY_DN2347_c0_g1_i5.p1  ORF type:complete len:592 (-),score=44.32 TRINITY_DN2347_c0_g1_i5:470-2086(-)
MVQQQLWLFFSFLLGIAQGSETAKQTFDNNNLGLGFKFMSLYDAESSSFCGKTRNGCSCKEEWSFSDFGVFQGCANPGAISKYPWCIVDEETCDTPRGQLQNGEMFDLCMPDCVDPLPINASDTILGCECKSTWDYENKEQFACENPDGDILGRWCVVDEATCVYREQLGFVQNHKAEAFSRFDYCFNLEQRISRAFQQGDVPTDQDGLGERLYYGEDLIIQLVIDYPELPDQRLPGQDGIQNRVIQDPEPILLSPDLALAPIFVPVTSSPATTTPIVSSLPLSSTPLTTPPTSPQPIYTADYTTGTDYLLMDEPMYNIATAPAELPVPSIDPSQLQVFASPPVPSLSPVPPPIPSSPTEVPPAQVSSQVLSEPVASPSIDIQVDDCLLPQLNQTLDTVGLTTFNAFIVETKLYQEEINGKRDYTFFALSNEAIQDFADSQRIDIADFFLFQANIAALKEILRLHIVPERLLLDQLVPSTIPTLLEGAPLNVSMSGAEVVLSSGVTNATVINADTPVDVCEGFVYIIDTLLEPPILVS